MSGKESKPTDEITSDGFGSTTWSLVLEAGKSEDGGPALERLCRKHWRPIYVFVRRSGLSPVDSEDATQEFFIELLEREWLKLAHPGLGSFRAFLLALLRNFLSNRRRVSRAERRGGGAAIISLDGAEGERALSVLVGKTVDPSQAYEVAWANGVLQSAWDRLYLEQKEAGKSSLFESLCNYVTQAPATGDYQRLSEQLGMRRGQIALLIHRLNRRFRELIRSEVAETLVDRSELDSELRFLLKVSSR
jgi:DNA-directed RNA polymerase specialized sigma24 family protein